MKQISEKIRYVGVNDDLKSLFEGLWPLPLGVSYNSYIVTDEKTALIDTVGDGFEGEFLKNIRESIGDKTIDYLIVNHMEPDHSALISQIRSIYPGIRIVASAKAVPMLKGYHSVPDEDILVVNEGDKLSLGCCSFTFHMIPMVHWPETMVTWLEEEHTLFSGDAFGTFGAVHGTMTDGFDAYKDEMTRYYANIVGKYGVPVQTALKKLSGLEIARICSTHGPVWENEIAEVVNLYDRLSRYEADKGVCIVYGSMYGNTAQAAKYLAEELEKNNIPYAIHNLNGFESMSAALRDLFKYDTLAVGSPTYNGAMFPPIEAFMRAVALRLVKNRKFFAFGSYTWAAASVRQLNEAAGALGFDIAAPGKVFAQAFSTEKCDMAEVVKLLK